MHVATTKLHLQSIEYQVAEGARLRGASKIIGVDLNPEKFEIGKLSIDHKIPLNYVHKVLQILLLIW